MNKKVALESKHAALPLGSDERVLHGSLLAHMLAFLELRDLARISGVYRAGQLIAQLGMERRRQAIVTEENVDFLVQHSGRLESLTEAQTTPTAQLTTLILKNSGTLTAVELRSEEGPSLLNALGACRRLTTLAWGTKISDIAKLWQCTSLERLSAKGMNMESLRVAALPRLRHLRVTHLSSFRLQPFLETYAHLESLDIQVTSHGGARTGLFRALTTLPHLTAARLHLSVAANDEATQEEGGVLRMPSLQSLVISCRNATSGAEIFPSTLWAPVLTRLTLTASCLPARRVRLAFPTLQELTVDQHCFTRDDPDSAERVRPPAEAPAAGWVQSAVEGRPLRLTVLGGGVRTATDSMVWAVTRLADRLTEMSLCFKELNEVSLRRLLQPVRLQLTALHLSVDSISMESSRSLHARHLDLIHCPRLRRLYLRPATLAFPFRSITLHPEFEYL